MNQDTSTPFQHIPINQVVASKTNPRKRFQEDKLQELASNIKLHGVMQPVLVRPIDKHGRPVWLADSHDTAGIHKYEIVAGERRWRASKLAGMEFIPCVVRELHDLDALQLQVFENLHRADLHPMEEAEGFNQLLKKNQDLIGLTVDELALKVGKSRAYIYASLKLLDLCDEARDAFIDGKFNASVALLIARIPGKALQMDAIKATTNYDGEPMSYRSAARIIQNRYTLQINRAVFDIHDATLITAAGSCQACPKLSGNCMDICQDIGDADVCTDPDCFASKKSAHYQRMVETAQSNGLTIISGEEAESIMPYRDSYLTKGYCNGKSFKELLGDDMPPPVIVHNNKGIAAEAWRESELEALVKTKAEAGEIEIKPEEPRELSQYEIDRQKKAEAQEIETERRKLIFAAINRKLGDYDKSPPLATIARIAIEYFLESSSGNAVALLAHHGNIEEKIKQPLDSGYLVRLLAEIIAAEGAIVGWGWGSREDDAKDTEYQRLLAIAESLGIDPENPNGITSESAPPPSTAAHASDSNALPEVPEPFAEIREKTLARRARRGKKESAGADADMAANAAEGAVAA